MWNPIRSLADRAMLAARRDPEVYTLAALLLGAGGCLALAVVFPLSPGAPVRLAAAGIVLAVVMAVATLVFGRRLPRGALLAQAWVALAANSVLVAASTTRAGAMADALAYCWLTAYVGIFFAPRATIAFTALSVIGFGAGVHLAGLPAMEVLWVLTSGTVVAIGVLTGWVSRTLRLQAGTDPLTGAANRAGLERAAESVVQRRQIRPAEVTVAAWDLDGFKQVNDRHGHAAGDRLLTDAVGAWRSVLRRGDVLARVGGDEFVLLMPATTDEEAKAVLERLREAHPVTWSAGLAHWRSGEPLDACVARADRRLYEVKAARRSRRRAPALGAQPRSAAGAP